MISLETSCFHSYSVFLSGLILADIYVYLARDSVLTLHIAQLGLQYTLCMYSNIDTHRTVRSWSCNVGSHTHCTLRSWGCNVLYLYRLHRAQLKLQHDYGIQYTHCIDRSWGCIVGTHYTHCTLSSWSCNVLTSISHCAVGIAM
jgi:hypothetical protein